MLEKLKNLVEELKAGLPTQSRLVLSESIDPTRALILREVCLFRITELAESAYDAFKKDNLITAFILSRAIMETASLFWSFLNEIEKALTTKDIEEIRNFLSSVLTGARASLAKELGRTLPSPHILKLIKNMDKIIPHYYDHYELLCEFTHPNAAGLNESYAKIDYDQNKVFFWFQCK